MTLRKILLEGKTKLGLHVGILSRIENEQYHVYEVESEYSGINKGDIFDLENAYCRDVFSNRKTMIFDNAAEISELLKHPCYLNTQLRAYIGTPLILDKKAWGTLNFSSLKPRSQDFTPHDFATIECLAQKASDIIKTQAGMEVVNQTPLIISK
ncbi:MAG: GAF domain-containing protein [Gammaproteobacteria bacterium]